MVRLPLHPAALFALLLGAVVSLAGCGQPREPVRIAALVWPPYELAFLARDLGYYPTDEIELVTYRTPAEMLRAYNYGLIDGMFSTSQFVLQRDFLPDDTRLVFAIDASAGGDALLARPGIESLQDLHGRRIGVEASPLGGYVLQRVLDHAGLERRDVRLSYVDTPDQEEAYLDDRVDAVIVYEPTRTRLLEAGAVELFNSKRIPREIIDVLMISESALSRREAALRAFVAGIERARKRITGGRSLDLQPRAQRQGLTTAQFQQALSGVELLSLADNRELLLGQDPSMVSLLNRQLEVMRRAGLIERPLPPEEIVDGRLVEGSDQ